MAEVQNANWIHAPNYCDYTHLDRSNVLVPNVMYNSPNGDAARERTNNPSRQQRSNVPGNSALEPRTKKVTSARSILRKAFVRIVEQPASKALRFRYECEGRLAGSIPGKTSTNEKKTFPTIEIVGYQGRAIVVVSCITKDPPYRPHPHNLVGKDGCKKGVCTVEVNTQSMRVVFSNLGIQCVKKKDIEQSLRLREEIRVDPFLTGFDYKPPLTNADLNSVRLCFQVFLENEKGRFTIPLAPVVSDPIYDKKATQDLQICFLCCCSCSAAGGKETVLLCEKVVKEDIAIRFYEERDGQTVWEAYARFMYNDVHKQCAIKFRIPAYQSLEIDEPVKVLVQLKRPSDGEASDSIPFKYLPLESDPGYFKRKRLELGGDPNIHLARNLQNKVAQKHGNTENHQAQSPGLYENQKYSNTTNNPGMVTGPTTYHAPFVNQQYYHHQHHDFSNYHAQHQPWIEMKHQPAESNGMSVNNFNANGFLTAPDPSHSTQWNILQNNLTYRQNETHDIINVDANTPGLQHQQPININPELNKEQNGNFDVDTDLLMDLNSAELERLTL